MSVELTEVSWARVGTPSLALIRKWTKRHLAREGESRTLCGRYPGIESASNEGNCVVCFRIADRDYSGWRHRHPRATERPPLDLRQGIDERG